MVSSKWKNIVEDQKYRSHPCTFPCCYSKYSIILLNSFSESINKNISLKTPQVSWETVYLLLSALNCQKLKALQDILIQTHKFYLTIFENE